MALDEFTRSHWYPIGRLEDVPEGGGRTTRLLGHAIVAERRGGKLTIRLKDGTTPLKVQERYGYVRTTLSDDPRQLYDIPEFEEQGRRLVPAGCISARCSGLRAVENFLDLAHLPFVHPNILGIEEQAGVEQYEVEIAESGNEIWATECKFYRPLAGAFGERFGEIGHYKYRVAHPFSAIIYMTCPIKEDAWDLIGLFIQPVEEDRSDLHSFLLVFDEDSSDTDLLQFQQFIFVQDRVILENQVPLLLPLDPRHERPTRADASSVAYRRWLRQNGVTYGAITRDKAA